MQLITSHDKTDCDGKTNGFMACDEFLVGNSEVSLELQCFTAQLIIYIVCECDAPECPTRTQPMGEPPHTSSIASL